jgi:hypothetical protein
VKRLALAFLLFAAWPAYAQMYKCVDERGVTHYSDKPRPGCKGGPVDIRPIPSISGEAAPADRDVATQDADFKRRQIERGQAETKEKAQLAEACARLRQEENWLSHGGRISQTDAQGKHNYVDDATRAARLARVKEQLRLCL